MVKPGERDWRLVAFAVGLLAVTAAFSLGVLVGKVHADFLAAKYDPQGRPIGETCSRDGFCFDWGPGLQFEDRMVRHCTITSPDEDCFLYEVMTPEEQRQAAERGAP